jgi:hypothetical protein
MQKASSCIAGFKFMHAEVIHTKFAPACVEVYPRSDDAMQILEAEPL